MRDADACSVARIGFGFLGIVLRSLGQPITKFTFDDTLTQIGLGYFFFLPLRSRLDGAKC